MIEEAIDNTRPAGEYKNRFSQDDSTYDPRFLNLLKEVGANKDQQKVLERLYKAAQSTTLNSDDFANESELSGFNASIRKKVLALVNAIEGSKAEPEQIGSRLQSLKTALLQHLQKDQPKRPLQLDDKAQETLERFMQASGSEDTIKAHSQKGPRLAQALAVFRYLQNGQAKSFTSILEKAYQDLELEDGERKTLKQIIKTQWFQNLIAALEQKSQAQVEALHQAREKQD